MRKLLTTTLVAVFLPLFAFSQCSSLKLSVDKKTQCAPGIVNFKITGAPNGSSYQWDFGNGFTTNTDTVYEFFINPKDVDVTVKTTFPNGTKCTTTAKKITRILPKPQISYSISREKLCDGPDTVTLVNTTPKTQSISWIVDGTNYNNSSNTLVHRFKTAGTKDLNIVITDTFGCENVQEFKDVAIVHPDVLMDFSSSDTSGCVTKEVKFTSSINSQNEKITNTEWHFPGSNNQFVSGSNPPVVSYSKSGKYTIGLTVKTQNGCVHELKKNNYLNFGDSLGLKLNINDSILCLKNSTKIEIENPIENATYTWSFYGNPDTSALSSSAVQLKYDTAGEYALGVTLDHAGCRSKWFKTGAIKVKTLEAKFESPDNYHCFIPHTVHILNQSQSYQNAKMNYLWNLYDEQGVKVRSTTSTNITHKALTWERRTVELIATDEFGCKDTFDYQHFIRIDTIKPIIFSEERIGCVNQPIKLKSLTPLSSYISNDSFYWVVYDRDGKTVYNQGVGKELTQTFTKPGFYDVKLLAGNKIGCVDSIKRTKYIEIVEPVKGFDLLDSIICSRKTIRMKATTSPFHAPFLHSWVISNQKSGKTYAIEPDTTRDVSIQLFEMGTYDVKYLHQINNGCKDSIIRKGSIHVNGVTGYEVVDKTSGCLPLKVNAKFQIIENKHYGSPSSNLEYSWWALPDSGVKITNSIAAAPSFTFTKKGESAVLSQVKNSAGCAYSRGNISELNTVYAGVEADFELTNDSLCVFDTLNLIDKSPLNPTSTRWEVLTSGKYTLTKTDTISVFSPEQNNAYKIRLIANKDNECYDTMERLVSGIQVVSDFEVTDTHLVCAPAYAQFKTLSTNADTFFWSFGDGNKLVTTDRAIANIYNRNTGLSNGYNVTLVSKSYLGCTDKVVKPDALKVFGPIPDFEITNTKGCEPLQVNFINKSTDFATYFLNYDDNSDLDSITFNVHEYKVQNSSTSQQFVPSLYIRDSLGCAAAIESKDTIVILRSPKAFPEDKEIEGCSPVQVALTDESQDASNRRWLLNKVDFSAATTVNPSISDPGNHTLNLIVSNENSCFDTSTFTIKVNPNPKVKINLNQLACLNGPTNFSATSDISLVNSKFTWFIENQTFVEPNSEYLYQFSQPGWHPIFLDVIDQNGCKGATDTTIFIRDSKDIPKGKIKRVSINDIGQIEIYWEDINDEFIDFSSILDNQLNEVVYEEKVNANQTVSVTVDDLKTTHCFSMHHTNLCGEKGEVSESHCPIVLNVSKREDFELLLSWSPYIGWASVDQYHIYKSMDGQTFEKLTSVGGNTLKFIDTKLCNEDYFYRVEAEYRDLHSTSNIDGNIPNYTLNRMPLNVEVASVVNNEIVQVSWDTSQYKHTDHYLYTKYDANGNVMLESVELNETSITDESVDVSSENYIYHVQTVDHCNVAGIAGNYGKPMILKGFFIDNMSQLSWTPYEQWDDGVQYYSIEIFDGNNFTSVGKIPGTQTSYVDKEYHEELDGEYVYRIIAISYDSTVQSISNELVLIGSSVVWVPNAFSPNEDDHNPLFKPSAQFVYLINDGTYRTYEMTIYNRWGEELFHTNDIKEGWDGTYLNKDCEPESYMYHIRINGLDRVIYDKKGLVRLMR